MESWFDQGGADLGCEWGLAGVAALATSDAIVIVDVLSFSTCVAIALERGASVLPCRFRGDEAAALAQREGALLARPRGEGAFSLSPTSLLALPAGARLVLPSPNGATLSLATGETPTLTGCLRNARAVALAASAFGPRIGVVPAGERWRHDDSLRPAIEDWVGAGAILSHLSGSRSPEAQLAIAAFEAAKSDLEGFLRRCGSGRELIGRGYEDDVRLAAALDVGDRAPILRSGAYVRSV